MSEDEDETAPMLEGPMDMGSDGHDLMGFGPLMPTDSERSLMERVRQELKIELKQVHACIVINFFLRLACTYIRLFNSCMHISYQCLSVFMLKH